MREDGDRPVAIPAVPSAPAFPEPFDQRLIDVGDGHLVYVEQVGRPDGVPVLFLHGGPGSGCQPAHRRLFDPARHRAVLFDQRGAGRSRPPGGRHANTTQHLIADIERIRVLLGIDRFLLIGGSWGATLALAYAEAYPAEVAGIVLRATFLGTRRELEWAFVDGPRRLRPDLFRAFVERLPADERADSLTAYWRRILDPDRAVAAPAAWTWHDAERVLSEVAPTTSALRPDEPGRLAGPLPSTPFMEAHYFSNDCFLEPDQLLNDAGRLADIPGIIVQGRYDFLCPPATAFALADAWPAARIAMVEGAGHAMTEPGITPALVAAIAALSRSATMVA